MMSLSSGRMLMTLPTLTARPLSTLPDAQIAVNPKGKGILRFDADELPDGVSVDLWVHLTRVGGPEVLRSPREFVE